MQFDQKISFAAVAILSLCIYGPSQARPLVGSTSFQVLSFPSDGVWRPVANGKRKQRQPLLSRHCLVHCHGDGPASGGGTAATSARTAWRPCRAATAAAATRGRERLHPQAVATRARCPSCPSAKDMVADLAHRQTGMGTPASLAGAPTMPCRPPVATPAHGAAAVLFPLWRGAAANPQRTARSSPGFLAAAMADTGCCMVSAQPRAVLSRALDAGPQGTGGLASDRFKTSRAGGSRARTELPHAERQPAARKNDACEDMLPLACPKPETAQRSKKPLPFSRTPQKTMLRR